MPADGSTLTDAQRVSVMSARMTQEPTFSPPHRQPEQTTPEEGGVAQSAAIATRFKLWR